jgi:hypothetical protein
MFSKKFPKAQKKWLAGAAANHLSDSPGCSPRRNQFNNEDGIKSQTKKTG